MSHDNNGQQEFTWTDDRQTAAPSANVRADLKSVRRKRLAEIEFTKRELKESSFVYLYVLLEPDEDIVRYVGIATTPSQRYYAHLQAAGSRKPLYQWIASLIDRGTLPRMWVLARINGHTWQTVQHIDIGMLGRACEAELISTIEHRGFWGNGHLESSLLNLEFSTQNFFPCGLDTRKDRV